MSAGGAGDHRNLEQHQVGDVDLIDLAIQAFVYNGTGLSKRREDRPFIHQIARPVRQDQDVGSLSRADRLGGRLVSAS